MKIKIVAILLCIFSVVTALSFGGCDPWEVPAPTKENVISRAKSWGGVSLPEDITIINYAFDAGINDGEWLYILGYSGDDENFINSLSAEKEDKVAAYIKEECKRMSHRFNEPYEMPDLSDGYLWLYAEEASSSNENLITRKFYILYVPSENQILMNCFKL